MRRVRLAHDGMPPDGAKAVVTGRPGPARSKVFKGFAAFLLGLTLGVSGIIIGQTAFTGDHDGAQVLSEPVPLRR